MAGKQYKTLPGPLRPRADKRRSQEHPHRYILRNLKALKEIAGAQLGGGAEVLNMGLYSSK